MIYGSKWYYYFAIIEDFVLRLSWVMNVSLAEAWFILFIYIIQILVKKIPFRMLQGDLLICIMAPLEVLRR
jgi:hypothetical protein